MQRVLYFVYSDQTKGQHRAVCDKTPTKEQTMKNSMGSPLSLNPSMSPLQARTVQAVARALNARFSKSREQTQSFLPAASSNFLWRAKPQKVRLKLRIGFWGTLTPKSCSLIFRKKSQAIWLVCWELFIRWRFTGGLVCTTRTLFALKARARKNALFAPVAWTFFSLPCTSPVL